MLGIEERENFLNDEAFILGSAEKVFSSFKSAY